MGMYLSGLVFLLLVACGGGEEDSQPAAGGGISPPKPSSTGSSRSSQGSSTRALPAGGGAKQQAFYIISHRVSGRILWVSNGRHEVKLQYTQCVKLYPVDFVSLHVQSAAEGYIRFVLTDIGWVTLCNNLSKTQARCPSPGHYRYMPDKKTLVPVAAAEHATFVEQKSKTECSHIYSFRDEEASNYSL